MRIFEKKGLVAAVCLGTSLCCCAAEHRPLVRFGLMAFTATGQYTTYVQQDDFVLKNFAGILEKTLPQYRFDIQVMRTSELVRRARRSDIDLIFGSSGCFAELLPDGIYPIATLTTDRAPDPNQAVAGAIVVRADRTDLQRISDLKGKRGIGGTRDMFFNYQLPVSALFDRGLDPVSFFRELIQVDYPVGKVLDAVRSGRADGGLLRACVLEEMPERLRREFRVLEPVADSPLHCLHTSRLFPNWTVGALKHVPSSISRDVAAALLTAEPMTEIGIRWSIANSFDSIDGLYRKLKYGRYEYLNHWTLERFWRVAWPFVMAGAFGLLVLIYHLLSVKKLVALRTRDLSNEIDRRKQLEKENLEVSQKFYRMERESTMGQLSNMVAHEIRQPLAALHARLHTASMVVDREGIHSPVLNGSLQGASRETERISQIVDHICSYYRGGRRNEIVNMADVVREVVREATAIGLTEYPVGLELTSAANVRGDPLELKLIVYNLVKNSVEAARESCSGDPGVRVSLVAEGETVKLVCSDQASEVTPQQLERIRSRQTASTKTKGLGLGLSVVRAIIESHAGTIAFEHNDQGKGLKVVVSLPRNYEQGAGQ